MKYSPPGQQASTGFTLVELQIALLLTAMITMLMVGAFRMTLQTWDKNTAKQDLVEHRYLIDQFIRRHLNSMRFVRLRNTQNRPMVSFLGDSEKLHFVAPYPIYDNDGTLFLWTLKNQAQKGGKKPRLILEYYPHSPTQTVEYDPRRGVTIEGQEPTVIVVAQDTRIDSLEYYFKDDKRVESWVDRWKPSRFSPGVIRLKLQETNPAGEDIDLLEISVSPRFAQQHLLSQVGG